MYKMILQAYDNIFKSVYLENEMIKYNMNHNEATCGRDY